MHTLHLALEYLVAHRVALLSLVGGGAGLSVLLEVVLHKFKIDSKKLAFTLLHVLSLAGAGVAYVLSNTKYNVVPAWAGLTIAAQVAHRFLVSPAMTKYVTPFLEFEAGQKPAPTTEAAPTAADASFVQ